MALVTKNDVTQIFAIQAPSIDLPPTFANYPRGWDVARANNGKPTIKQFNYIQQRTDQNVLWIHQNGAGLPYDAAMEYAENAHVVKDGELQKKDGASWVSATNKGYNLDYFVSGKSYPLHAELMLSNGDIVKSTVADNIVDPNVDMTVWLSVGNTSEVESIDDLTAIQNPQNGQLVRTLSYHNGLSKGGNLYRYEPSRQLENDGGGVLNGWVVQDKTALTVWDFGYKDGDAAQSTTAIKKAFASTCALFLKAETYSSHTWSQVDCPANKVVFGQGKAVSVINGLKISAKSGNNYLFKGFKIVNETGSINYGIVIENYDNVVIEDYEAENTYDAVSIWQANTNESKAVVKNCVAKKAARIGFTADLGAKNVLFIDCDTYDSHQGFHGELNKNTRLVRCRAIRCGSTAPVPWTDQPQIYAGGFRFHDYEDVVLQDCENIDKAGSNIDWLGGGGTGLRLENCSGLRFVTDDVAIGQLEPSYTFTNIECINSNTTFRNQGYKSNFAGYFKANGVGSLELGYSNKLSLVSVEKLNGAYCLVGTTLDNATLYLNEINLASQYASQIKGFTFINCGNLYYSWLTGDESQYPNLGFRFDATKARTFNLQSFTSVGRGGGTQISLEDINASLFKGGFIGKIASVAGIDAFIGLDTERYNISRIDSLSNRTVNSSTPDLTSKSSNINTYSKFLGRDVYNTTISKFMKATGSSATSTWVSYDGVTTITPA